MSSDEVAAGPARTFAQTIRSLCETSYFRQASSIAFIFLLVTLMTTIWSRSLIENVLYNHVREMVLSDIRAQHALGMDSAAQVRSALYTRDYLEYRTERKVLLLGPYQRVEYGDPALLSVIGCLDMGCHGWRHVEWTDAEGNHAELLGLVVPLADGSVYFSSYDIQPMMERVGILPLTAGASLFIVLLFSTGISVAFGADSLKRVDTIRSVLRRYVAGDSAVRTPVGQRRDEIDRLGENINQALARINRMMEEVKSASSHIAHELGTPLTRLQNRLSSAAELTGDVAVQQEIALAAEEAERIQKLSRAILRIGEIESGRCLRQFEYLDAGALLTELADYYQPLAELRGNALTVSAPPGSKVYGDRALLMQAMSNLLDNALKYAAPGTPVTMFVRAAGDLIELGVADRGPGIPADQRESTLLRFSRLRQTSSVPGYGLGLALVQAIAKLHGGELAFADNECAGVGQRPGVDDVGIQVLLRLERHHVLEGSSGAAHA
ncbi:MAG: HAMP domain-containing sensor histidine kinase [Corticimicrobacter sp.]|uniref:sensor histidine kinase n=1 Tax=Corticimicrobacter sp. TaxID=2678536 RepID=UPI0032DAAFB2